MVYFRCPTTGTYFFAHHDLYGITLYVLFPFFWLHPKHASLNRVNGSGEFQGPAVVAVLDGATLNQEEVSSLQLLPPWRLWGNTLNYGLGLLSCYFICDLPAVVSSGHFYMFDPHGKALTAPSSNGPSAKMFSLRGNLILVSAYFSCFCTLNGSSQPYA